MQRIVAQTQAKKKVAKIINEIIIVPRRWLKYMTQVRVLLELIHASGLLTWILPSGCHKVMTPF